MTIQGDVKTTITCEDGEKKKLFLEKVATRLPVEIQGSDAVVQVCSKSESLLSGRVQQVLDMRKSSQDEHVLAIPKTCDMTSEFILTVGFFLTIWYVFQLLPSTIDWAIRKASDQCGDIMTEDVDYCDPVTIFTPIQTLQNPSDYVGLILLIFVPISVIFTITWTMDRHYHFGKNAIWSSPRPMHESQQITAMFKDEISSVSLLDSSWEKGLMLRSCVVCDLTNGIKKPFCLTMKFKDDIKKTLRIVDADCASCSGQKGVSVEYNKALRAAVEEMLPGMLEGTTGTSSSASNSA